MAALLAGVASVALAQETPRTAAPAPGSRSPAPGDKPSGLESSAPDRGVLFHPESVASIGSVTVEGRPVDNRAVAGMRVVHPKGVGRRGLAQARQRARLRRQGARGRAGPGRQVEPRR